MFFFFEIGLIVHLKPRPIPAHSFRVGDSPQLVPDPSVRLGLFFDPSTAFSPAPGPLIYTSLQETPPLSVLQWKEKPPSEHSTHNSRLIQRLENPISET
jgi:hypothetical protein